MTEGKTYRKWIIFDGCSGSPKLQGPDIAYADNPEVVDIQALKDANERIEKLESRNLMLSNLTTSQGIRDMEQLERIKELEAENQSLKDDKGITNPYLVKDRLIKSLEQKLSLAKQALEWQKAYIHNYCIFVSPTKNKDGLETDKHMIAQIDKALAEIEGEK